MAVTAEQIERLPKWAQDRIRTLEREADAARRVMRKIEGEQTHTRIWVEYFECMGEGVGPTTAKRYIDGRHVCFAIGGQYVEVGYDNQQRLTIRTCGPRLLLKCEVSNAIEIGLEKYD